MKKVLLPYVNKDVVGVVFEDNGSLTIMLIDVVEAKKRGKLYLYYIITEVDDDCVHLKAIQNPDRIIVYPFSRLSIDMDIKHNEEIIKKLSSYHKTYRPNRRQKLRADQCVSFACDNKPSSEKAKRI